MNETKCVYLSYESNAVTVSSEGIVFLTSLLRVSSKRTLHCRAHRWGMGSEVMLYIAWKSGLYILSVVMIWVIVLMPVTVLSSVVTALLIVHTHTHNRFTALFPGLPGWAGTRKVKPVWILLRQWVAVADSAKALKASVADSTIEGIMFLTCPSVCACVRWRNIGLADCLVV